MALYKHQISAEDLARFRQFFETATPVFKPDEREAYWHTFCRFITGNIRPADYYSERTHIREQVEFVIGRIGNAIPLDVEHRPLRSQLLTRFSEQAQQAAGEGHWREGAQVPEARMYLDAAQIFYIPESEHYIADKMNDLFSRKRIELGMRIDTAVADAIDEALLLHNLADSNQTIKFVGVVIRNRVEDAYRCLLTKTVVADRRAGTLSLDGASDEDSKRIGKPACQESASSGMEIEDILDLACKMLPSYEARALRIYAVSKMENPRITVREVATSMGISPNTLNVYLDSARHRIRAAYPHFAAQVLSGVALEKSSPVR